ncbi:MAG: ABC transporter substrate-binding protein, partial [Pseudomonadota bacterium]
MADLKRLQTELAQGTLSRRNFIAFALASGATMATATMMADKAKAATTGGTLRIGASGGNTVDNFDGATHADFFMQLMGMGVIFDCLTEVAPDGSLRGELAESWEASADAATWTFRLREAEFHNGKSFGADDVIESLVHHSGEDSKSAAKPLVSPISEMKKLDDRTVRITLAQGNADFPYLMSDYHLLMYPAGMKDEAIAKGIGTGGYVLEDFDPGVRGLAKKNPNDYRSDRVMFDSLEVIGINDSASRINALVTGEVDVINKIEPKAVRLLARNNNIFISEVTGNQHYTFPMHTTVAPFDNNDVRMAIKFGINRAEMVQKILSGHGAVGNDHPIGPANQFFYSDLEQREFDPDRAKFHLKQAGLD